MTDYAPLKTLLTYIEPHHVAQMVHEAVPSVQQCIIRTPFSYVENDGYYVRISDYFKNKVERKTFKLKSKLIAFEILIEKYEGTIVKNTLIIRKILA